MQTGDLDVADPDTLLDAIALASAAEVTPNRWFINGDDFIVGSGGITGSCLDSPSR
jgi:hypothetical protein